MQGPNNIILQLNDMNLPRTRCSRCICLVYCTSWFLDTVTLQWLYNAGEYLVNVSVNACADLSGVLHVHSQAFCVFYQLPRGVELQFLKHH